MAFQRMTHSQLDFSQSAVLNDTILTTTALDVSLSEGSSSSLLNVFILYSLFRIAFSILVYLLFMSLYHALPNLDLANFYLGGSDHALRIACGHCQMKFSAVVSISVSCALDLVDFCKLVSVSSGFHCTLERSGLRTFVMQEATLVLKKSRLPRDALEYPKLRKLTLFFPVGLCGNVAFRTLYQVLRFFQ